MPEVGSAPLTGRIQLDVNNIKQKEKLGPDLSPILIDARRTEPLSLEKVLDISVHRNLDYLQSKWLGRSAFLTFLGSAAAMQPYAYGYSVQNVYLKEYGTPAMPFTTVQPTDYLRYNVYGPTISTGGTTFLTMLTNYFKSRVATYTVKTSLQDTMFEACNNYFALCRDISLLHVNDIVVENSKEIANLNQGLFDCGMGTKLQVLQALTQLASDRQQLVSQQAQTRISAIKLAVTLNMPLVDYILPVSHPLEKITLVDPSISADRLALVALQQRPEIARARNQVRTDLAQAGQALTPIIPTASYSYNNGAFFPSNGQGPTRGVQRTLQLTWQLNNLGIPVLPNFASGLAQARADQYALRNVELNVRADVRQAYDNCLAYNTNIGIAKLAAAQAQEQLLLAEERLKSGIGINIDVIQAQSALTVALRNYVNAIYSYNMEQAKLRRAIGGFTISAVKSRLYYE